MSEGIGARLRGARERSRLTILQAAEKLHVDPDVLEALEEENFAALGAPVYVKGHLRHYAELVGESAEALFELYSQGARVSQPDLTRIPRAQPDETRGLVVPAAIVLIGFALAGTAWWLWSLPRTPSHAPAARPVPVTVTPVAPVPQNETIRVALGGHPMMAADRPVPAAKPDVMSAGRIQVVLTFSADSWTEVYDATGRRLLYGLSNGPATRRVEGVPPLSVMLGNASDVSVAVAGRTESISRFVRSDHTARFLIAADGRELAPAPPKKGG